MGSPTRRGLLDYAWKLLLKNQPHDSICGCSMDEVHREMGPRFDGVVQTAERTMPGDAAGRRTCLREAGRRRSRHRPRRLQLPARVAAARCSSDSWSSSPSTTTWTRSGSWTTQGRPLPFEIVGPPSGPALLGHRLASRARRGDAARPVHDLRRGVRHALPRAACGRRSRGHVPAPADPGRPPALWDGEAPNHRGRPSSRSPRSRTVCGSRVGRSRTGSCACCSIPTDPST